MSQFDRRQRGQSNVEYALVLILVAIVIILVLVTAGGGLGRSYQKVADALGGAPAGGTAEFTPEPLSTSEATAPVTSDEPTATTPEAQATAVPSGAPSSEPTAVPQATAVPGGDNPGDDDPSGEPTPVAGNASGGGDVSSYYDEFDGSGNIQWTNDSGVWATSHEYFTSAASSARVFGTITFDNYEFSAEARTMQAGSGVADVMMILFRAQSSLTYYAVMLKKDGVVELAANRNGHWQSWLSATATRLNPTDNHTFRIKAFGDHLQIYVDNRKYVDYRDPDPILSGGIGFANNNSQGRVDNVQVERRQGS